jgi:sirohydrochlorin ferrochelatase
VDGDDPREGRRAVVLVDHGSRAPEANAVLEAVAERLRARLPDRRVHVAHMEIASPRLDEAIDACVAEGAREIVVHPYFLGPGRHATRDIPRMAAEAAARHPQVEVRVTEPLGVHDGLVDAVVERISAPTGPTRTR